MNMNATTKLILRLLSILLSFGIWYLLVYTVFWVFGPTILGYTISFKLVISTWLIVILTKYIFR